MMANLSLGIVLVTDVLEPPSLLERLQAAFQTVHYYPQLAANDYSAVGTRLPPPEVLRAAEVLFTFRLPANLRHIDQAPHLKLVQVVGSGTTQITNSEFFRSIPASNNLILANSAGIHSQSIGEHVIMSLLMLNHKILAALRVGRDERRWASPQELGGLHITEMRGKVVGMLPYGAVSREIARLASAFGARIIACTREGSAKTHTGYCIPGTGDSSGSLPEKYYKLSEEASFHEFLSRCDVVVNMLPSATATRCLVGRREFGIMKDDVIFVNVGRGDTVDTAVLVEALQTPSRSGSAEPNMRALRVGAAVLDVTDPEPLPDGHILFTLPNVILTPHCSWVSEVNFHRAVDLLELNVARLLTGERVLNLLRGR